MSCDRQENPRSMISVFEFFRFLSIKYNCSVYILCLSNFVDFDTVVYSSIFICISLCLSLLIYCLIMGLDPRKFPIEILSEF